MMVAWLTSMATLRKLLVLLLSCAALGAVAWGIQRTLHSPLFIVQVVEVTDQPEHAPVDAQTITELAAVPVGKINLFELDLKKIEERILNDPRGAWIREVYLQKRFPQTLAISVAYREPRALIQGAHGSLAYVDREGKIFGKLTLAYQPDLPLLTGFLNDDQYRVLDAIHFLEFWNKSPASQTSEISSLAWDDERGFRAVVTYPVAGKRGRTVVDLGQEPEAELEQQLQRLSRVLVYLGRNSVAARQIWADAGKKIVVKTARGS